MALDFPNSPTVGQTFPSPAVAGVPVWKWDGSEWVPVATTPSPLAPTMELLCSIAVSAASGALTIALKDAAGNDPSATNILNFWFRDSAGGPLLTQLSVTSPQSVTIPSGGTLGVLANAAFRLWVILFNDAGTPRLGVICCSSNNTAAQNASAAGINPLDEPAPKSSVAASSSSNSTGTPYTNVAVTTKSFRIIAYAEWSSAGIATAGTWTTTNLLTTRTFGPGVKKPGDILSAIYQFSSTGSSSNTTFVNAGQITITQESAANLIRYGFSGTMQVLAGGAGTNTQVNTRVIRGASTVVSGPFSGSVGTSSGINAQILTPGTHQGLDFPNNVGAIAYTAQVASAGAAASATYNSVNMFLEEIMT